jgi:hypothetical protein
MRRSAVMATTVLLLIVVAIKFFGYEPAPYQLVWTDGNFELRDYPALTLAEATSSQNADNNFMRLYRFITGSNQAQQKTAMTTPVFMSGGGANDTMAFVMPAKINVSQVPKPNDNGLTVI